MLFNPSAAMAWHRRAACGIGRGTLTCKNTSLSQPQKTFHYTDARGNEVTWGMPAFQNGDKLYSHPVESSLTVGDAEAQCLVKDQQPLNVTQ
jgi:hypothetical protein